MKGKIAFGAGLIGVVIGAALVSLIWTPRDPGALAVAQKLLAPSRDHWFGTDHLGRDILSMLMTGGRMSLGVALIAVAIGAGLGVPLGLAAAAGRDRGGLGALLDGAITRANDVIFAFPALVTAILLSATLGPSATNAVVAIGIFNIPVFARVTRAGALGLWRLDFLRAAEVAGKGRARISVEHVLPNIASLLIVQATIQFSLGILAEAGLSYVGLGAQPPTASWGRMLAEAQTFVTLAPHVALFPGGVIMATVLGLNLLGDGLRDALDPRLKGRAP